MPRRNRTPKPTPFVDTNPCKQKRRFSSEQSVRAAAENQNLQNDFDLTTYKCERCGGWHLTRLSKS